MKGLIVFSHNMEDVESLATRALLVRAGFEVHSLTFENTKHINTAFHQEIIADYTMDEIEIDTYDFVVIPGGKYVSQTVNQDVNIKIPLHHFIGQASGAFLSLVDLFKPESPILFDIDQEDTCFNVVH